MIILFPLAIIPLVALSTILLSVIAGAALSALIAGATDFLRYKRLTKEKLDNLKKKHSTLRSAYLNAEGKCIWEYNSPYGQRLRDLEERAWLLIASGDEKLKKFGYMQIFNIDYAKEEYDKYKHIQVKLDEDRIRNLQRRYEDATFWDYVNKRTIAAQLRKKWVMRLSAFAGAAATLYELWPLIDELVKTIDDTVAEVNALPTQCVPIGQTRSFSWSESKSPGRTCNFATCSCSPKFLGSKTFTNPFAQRARLTISGNVDDDVYINGSLYPDGATIFLCGMNGAHRFSYTQEVGPGESTTVAYYDNHGGSSGITVSVSYTTI